MVNAREMLFDCHHEKVSQSDTVFVVTDKSIQETPVANTAKDTVILTWWFARQLIDTNKVKSRSVDWRMETGLADHILSNRGLIRGPTIGLLQEELVSPSIYPVGGKDFRIDNL